MTDSTNEDNQRDETLSLTISEVKLLWDAWKVSDYEGLSPLIEDHPLAGRIKEFLCPANKNGGGE